MNRQRIKKWIRNVIIGFGALILLTVIVEVIDYFYVDYRFTKRITPWPINKTPQIWAHRGYHVNVTPNSLAAFEKANQLGVTGIELDIHFDKHLETCKTRHDWWEMMGVREVFENVPCDNSDWVEKVVGMW